MKKAILKYKTLLSNKIALLKQTESQQLKLFIPMFIVFGFAININLENLTNLFEIAIFAIFYGGLILIASVVDKKYIAIYVLWFVFGTLAWQFIQKPKTTQKALIEYHKNVNITCKIADIQNKINKISFVCINAKINEGIETNFFDNITKIKLFYKNNDTDNSLKVGDTVNASVDLFALPSKSHYSSYNYHEQLMYNGFAAMGSVKKINSVDPNKELFFVNKLFNFFKNLRLKIHQDISQKVENSDISAILKALTIGERGDINQEINNQISISGLSHILSISGLHIAIVAGFFMVFVKFCIVIFARNFALHYNCRKIGAFIAIFGSFFYLALSGFLVPAVRSFVMFSLILLAIISDRRAFTMYNFMLAACVVMLIYPYSVFFASFQLSFSAVICLIVSFNFLNKILKEHRLFYKYALAIVVSSAFINLVGIYLSLYHFGRFSLSSIFANIFAIPLTSFVIMPFCIVYIVLFTLGLGFVGAVFLKIAQFGVWMMLFIAKVFSSQQWFYITTIGPGDGIFYASCFSLIWLAFFKSKIRYIGLFCYAVVCFLYVVQLKNNKHLLTTNGEMAIYSNYDKNYLMDIKTDSFTLQTWQQELGLKNPPKRSRYNNIELNNNIVIITSLKTFNKGLCDMQKQYFVLNTVSIDEIYQEYQKCQQNNFIQKKRFFIKNVRINQIFEEENIKKLRGYEDNKNLDNNFEKWLELSNNIFCYLDFKFYGTHTIFKNSKTNDIIIEKVYE